MYSVFIEKCKKLQEIGPPVKTGKKTGTKIFRFKCILGSHGMRVSRTGFTSFLSQLFVVTFFFKFVCFLHEINKNNYFSPTARPGLAGAAYAHVRMYVINPTSFAALLFKNIYKPCGKIGLIIML